MVLIIDGPKTPKRDDLLKKKEKQEKTEYEKRERKREIENKMAKEIRLNHAVFFPRHRVLDK